MMPCDVTFTKSVNTGIQINILLWLWDLCVTPVCMILYTVRRAEHGPGWRDGRSQGEVQVTATASFATHHAVKIARSHYRVTLSLTRHQLQGTVS